MSRIRNKHVFFSDPINRNCCYLVGLGLFLNQELVTGLISFLLSFYKIEETDGLGYLSRGSLACKTDRCLSNSLITLLLCPKIDCIDLGQTCN